MGWLGTATARLLGRVPMPGLSASAAYYEGASTGRRFVSMQAPTSGPNTPILASGRTLADRTHALVRNEPFVRRAIDVLCAAVVGTGIMPRSELDDLPELQADVHTLWDRFMAELDADGVTDGYGLQALGLRTMFTGGDAFVRFRPRLADDRAPFMPVPLAVPLQVQLLEAEMVPRDKNEARLPNGGKIVGGIQFTPWGTKDVYHVYRDHPSERGLFGGMVGETVPVPASSIMHLHEIGRAGQVRGQPRASCAILPAHDFHQGEDALQKSWNLQAVLSAFIEISDYEVAVESGQFPVLTPAELVAARAANTGTATTTLEPGDVPVLKPGQQIKPFAPPSVGDTYDVAQKIRLRRLCAAFGTPYSAVSMDLSESTYSADRSGLMQFWAECDQLLWQTVVPQFLQPLWITFFDTAVRAGRLPLTLSAYLADPRKYLAVSWIPPKRPWVDPLKDVQGEVMAINNRLLSRDESILSRGGIPERVDQSIKRGMDRATAMGIPDPIVAAPAGARQTPPDVTDPADVTDVPNKPAATPKRRVA
jgi:lambda family phage portal protein